MVGKLIRVRVLMKGKRKEGLGISDGERGKREGSFNSQMGEIYLNREKLALEYRY